MNLHKTIPVITIEEQNTWPQNGILKSSADTNTEIRRSTKSTNSPPPPPPLVSPLSHGHSHTPAENSQNRLPQNTPTTCAKRKQPKRPRSPHKPTRGKTRTPTTMNDPSPRPGPWINHNNSQAITPPFDYKSSSEQLTLLVNPNWLAQYVTLLIRHIRLGKSLNNVFLFLINLYFTGYMFRSCHQHPK